MPASWSRQLHCSGLCACDSARRLPRALPCAGSVTARGRRGAACATGCWVVDLSALWAGPLCGHVLTTAGARVVKVESACPRLDGARRGPPAFYDLLHAGQESVALDLPDEADRLHAVVRAADIVVLVVMASRITSESGRERRRASKVRTPRIVFPISFFCTSLVCGRAAAIFPSASTMRARGASPLANSDVNASTALGDSISPKAKAANERTLRSLSLCNNEMRAGTARSFPIRPAARAARLRTAGAECESKASRTPSHRRSSSARTIASKTVFGTMPLFLIARGPSRELSQKLLKTRQKLLLWWMASS